MISRICYFFVIIPNEINNFMFKLRESCRQIDDRKWHSINLIQRHLRLWIFDALTRLNKRLFLAIGITLFLCGCGSHSGSSRPRIGIDPTWSPLNFGSQTSYVNGFTEELLLEIASHEGLEFERVPANWDDLVSGLNQKKFDAILTSLPPYSFNLAKYDFSQNFLDVGPVFIVGVLSPYKKIDQVNGEAIGIVSGDATWLVLQKFPQVIIQSFPSTPDLLNAVADGEIAGALLGRISAVKYVSDLYQGRLKIVSTPLTGAGLRLVAKKGCQEDLIRSFDDNLKFLKKKKRLKALMRKWSL